MEAILNIGEQKLRSHYLEVYNQCFDKLVSRSTYGNDKDILKSIKEMNISDLGSLIKTKGIRIKNTDDIDTIEDNAIDTINYAIEILRRI